jgi:transposase
MASLGGCVPARPGRTFPSGYGPHTTCYNRVVGWWKIGVWDAIFEAEAGDGVVGSPGATGSACSARPKDTSSERKQVWCATIASIGRVTDMRKTLLAMTALRPAVAFAQTAMPGSVGKHPQHLRLRLERVRPAFLNGQPFVARGTAIHNERLSVPSAPQGPTPDRYTSRRQLRADHRFRHQRQHQRR